MYPRLKRSKVTWCGFKRVVPPLSFRFTLCSSMPAEMTMLADHAARQLLDFSQKLDINLLDNVVNSMYYDIGSQVRSASIRSPYMISTHKVQEARYCRHPRAP